MMDEIMFMDEIDHTNAIEQMGEVDHINGVELIKKWE
jgi:hypothetical protein